MLRSCVTSSEKQRYGGWESTGISGHSIGHWLSATAQMYVITEDEKLKEKINYALDELAHIQSFDEEGYVSGFPRTCFDKVFTGDFEVEHFSLAGQWVPWYSIHKIYAGLIDIYTLMNEEKALTIVKKLADWAQKGLANLSDEEFEKMLTCEHGGMNEAMADLYLITGNEVYLNLAIRFCHKAVLEPLAKGVDELEGKHANTQIPKVIGAAKLYNITKEEKYKKIAMFFFEEVTKHRSYIIGGNSINEHFGPANSEKLGVQTTETCNTYNMLKLTELLFDWSHQADYFDYYEKALYNHILASQDPESGMKTYFVSTQPGHFKVYCSPDNSFWCCTGTGMENPARYTRNIYYQKNEDLYVNLFIASEITMNHKQLRIKQETDFPRSSQSTLYIEEGNGEVEIHIRVPYWVSDSMTVVVNDKETYSKIENGYVAVKRSWVAGDKIEVELPMDLHAYTAKDDPKKVGIMYGPVVLAGALGKENFPETDILGDHLKLNNHPLIDVPNLIADKNDLNSWIKPVKGSSLTFQTAAVGQPGNVQVTLIPFYELHHERYTLYWNVMDQESYKTFKDLEQEQLKRLQAITVDEVQPNEQQPEVEHNLKKENSTSDYLNIVQKGWRDSRDEGYFSYGMAVEPDRQMYLQVFYFGGDRALFMDGKTYEREFTILIDGTEIASQKLDANGQHDSLFDVIYEVPAALTEGKKQVEVKFASSPGKIAGGVYGLKMLNALP
ncbi:glycoside hydrolase family 127 protein [Halalkalibacter akibai]|uniref:Uncharacterized protein n=1 Tax=Halalkalibacter akibai (strain ATCC 43226 / DSM 21942 / CIP 109018 / JCM 9157 / 1139) TaxID=1236973 RepID=W4QQQ4_HALA3|nr:hypothetical protein JCM9157_996 [Halalkalibacter akibai JCM 9157]